MVIGKRRVQYEQEIEESPKNYDIWFDYAKLEESAGDPTRVREVYERAIAQVPPAEEKRFWRRYIYLWINYALYEELESQDVERTRQIYEQCIQLIPHKKFTFAKIWLLYAQFEIRQMQVGQARKLLGRAIGMCPKNKLFKGYIDLEFQLREFDRCRTIYTKYLEYDPSNCSAWIQFAELEKNVLDEVERCRAIFELAVSQENLNMPELLWKAYIDFEIGEEEYDKTRDLYYRLLERTEHVKVYISFAQFELSIPYEGGNEQGVLRARKIFEGAYNKMKEKELKEEVRFVGFLVGIDILTCEAECYSVSCCLKHGKTLKRITVMTQQEKLSRRRCPRWSRREEEPPTPPKITSFGKNTLITSLQTMKYKIAHLSSCKWHKLGKR